MTATVAHRVVDRILALPGADQRRAVAYFKHLVEERRAELGPAPLDAVELARNVGLDPDPWQVDLLRSSATRILLNCSRQTGKSTITALCAVHAAHFETGALVLLLSPTLRQSQELFKKALAIHRGLKHPVATEAESALRLELKNGSRIISLPGKEHTVRGYSGVRLLAVDEAARVPDDLYFSVRPMLAVSGGRLMALSTPFGTRGWWYEAWRSDETWERYQVAAKDCPRIPPEFLAEERRTMGEWWYAQEYECEFLDAETQPFGREDVDRAFEEEVEAWEL
jgi:Terminase large subunit, T4likevirus-type, N-terminal